MIFVFAAIVLGGVILLIIGIQGLMQSKPKEEVPEAPKTVVTSPSENVTPTVTAILINKKNGNELPLNEAPLLLGRSENVSVQFNDNCVSRNHARIFLKNKNYFIEDLNSANGTLLNNLKLTPHKPYLLSNGDVIKIADKYEFIFYRK